MGEGLGGQTLAPGQVEAARRDRLEHVTVVARIHHDGDVGVVLGRGPDHRGTTDVDLFDAFLGGRAGRDRLAERVQVDDHELERLDAQSGELLDVVILAQVGEQSGVHAGVQRLHAPLQAFREAGDCGDLGDRDPFGRDRGRSGSGRHDLDAGLVEPTRQLGQPGFVVRRHQRSGDRGSGHGMSAFLPSMWSP